MSQNDQTLALHAGHNTTKTEGTRAVPIYQTTSYVFDDTDHAAKLFSLAEPGYIYTRLNNPTADVLEQRLASIEGGIAAVATSSGSAALATTLLTLLKTGDHIVSSNSLYGGTYNLLNVTLPRYGITTTFVDPNEVDNFSKAINNPFLVGLLLIFLRINLELLLINAATIKKALLERSFGTSIFLETNSFLPIILINLLSSFFLTSIFAPNASSMISV